MPLCEPGTRVTAIAEGTEDEVKIFGHGVYKGQEIPPTEIIGAFGISPGKLKQVNPKIELDNGQVIWGCECWWGPVDAVEKEIAGRPVKEVDIEEYRKKH